MTEDRGQRKNRFPQSSVERLRLDHGATKRDNGRMRSNGVKEEDAIIGIGHSSQSPPTRSASQSPPPQDKASQWPDMDDKNHEEVIGGEITVKQEPGQPPKLSRSTSHKIVPKPTPLFDDYPEKTDEAKGTFELITACSYTSKYIGSTEHDSMDCDCAEEWDSYARTNAACGADSDCINRATKMECAGGCACGADCQNQRFQKQEYADVTVIQTEKKGYGLRTNVDLCPEEMVYEYIGEVIDEARFRRRMIQYDEEGIKHFYFMSLSKGEFVDATKKGNLGRFCNHSCNPNCYVDKWVVGSKLRMGIFAERKIRKGEELVFNYNVDRYGANPQPCYCGEPNCTGFIGGKTQTERGTKLSNTTIEALGIDDGDGWDTAVAKKPRKKKVGEDDEEYVNNVQPKSLDENGVTKVMATLMQCKEKWFTVKLLGRIQRCDDERVRNRVVKMHGYQILNSALALWKEDPNIVLQIFDILDKFPRLTRNKISDSKIESTVEALTCSGDERVNSQAANLLKEWSSLEVGYRIPRKTREAAAISSMATPEKSNRFGRRDHNEERKARSRSHSRSRSRSRSIDAPRGPAIPSGPRSNFPQRNPEFFGGQRPLFRSRPFSSLPSGWFPATDENGRTYYYDASGKTTWQRPTMPAAPPPPPPKPTSTNKALEDIINEITSAKANTPKDKQSPQLPGSAVNGTPKKDSKGGSEKWRTYSEDKQRKLYENTLFPLIKHVMDKFKGKLSKDDLKRFAKEISKKLVNSDYKNGRVEDPTKISSRQEKQVKKYVQDYFEKAVAKKKDHEKRKAERKVKEEENSGMKGEEDDSDRDPNMAKSDDDDAKQKPGSMTPATPLEQLSIAEGLKRKRTSGSPVDPWEEQGESSTPNKRLKSESPPPPPPPPPAAEISQEPPPEQFDLDARSLVAACDESRHTENLTTDGNPDPKQNHLPLAPLSPRPQHAEHSHNRSMADGNTDIAGHAHPPDDTETMETNLGGDFNGQAQESEQHILGHRHRHVPELRT